VPAEALHADTLRSGAPRQHARQVGAEQALDTAHHTAAAAAAAAAAATAARRRRVGLAQEQHRRLRGAAQPDAAVVAHRQPADALLPQHATQRQRIEGHLHLVRHFHRGARLRVHHHCDQRPAAAAIVLAIILALHEDIVRVHTGEADGRATSAAAVSRVGCGHGTRCREAELVQHVAGRGAAQCAERKRAVLSPYAHGARRMRRLLLLLLALPRALAARPADRFLRLLLEIHQPTRRWRLMVPRTRRRHAGSPVPAGRQRLQQAVLAVDRRLPHEALREDGFLQGQRR
jgi:hypothetical protein